MDPIRFTGTTGIQVHMCRESARTIITKECIVASADHSVVRDDHNVILKEGIITRDASGVLVITGCPVKYITMYVFRETWTNLGKIGVNSNIKFTNYHEDGWMHMPYYNSDEILCLDNYCYDIMKHVKTTNIDRGWFKKPMSVMTIDRDIAFPLKKEIKDDAPVKTAAVELHVSQPYVIENF